MTRFLLLFVCAIVLCGCGRSLSDEHQKAFDDADRAFAAAQSSDDYLKVAGTYQQMIDDGVRSAAVLFNQGNAFMRAEQSGRAIACYRQALRLAPAESSIRNNLGVALAKTGGQNAGTNWFRRLVFWHDWVGYVQKFWLATIAILLAVGTLLFARWKGSEFGTRLGLFATTFAVICIISAVYDWQRFSNPNSGVVTASEAIARTGNGDSYEEAFNKPLPEGTEFTVLEQRGDWFRVQVRSAGEAWLPVGDVVVY